MIYSQNESIAITAELINAAITVAPHVAAVFRTKSRLCLLIAGYHARSFASRSPRPAAIAEEWRLRMIGRGPFSRYDVGRERLGLEGNLD